MKHQHSGRNVAVAMLSASLVAAMPAFAQDYATATASAEFAKKSLNLVADLMSVPFQYNHDEKIGSNDTGLKAN